MTPARVFGIDPGPIPGIVGLWVLGPERALSGIDVVQCSSGAAGAVLDVLLGTGSDLATLVQIERFVVGPRAAHSAHASAGTETRELIGGLLAQLHQVTSAEVVQRSAAAVKPWATDERLDAAGLLDATKGMRHARDAARHAMFAAVHNGTLPDPLSKEWINP